MRALKILTAVMGVLIIAGVVTLGVVLSNRLSVPHAGPALALDEPTVTRIAQVSTSGDRAMLLLQGGGPDRVVVIDLRSGAVLARTGLAR